MARDEGRLEILRRRPRGRRGLPPVLLVHGAWHGAWCWDQGFMERLAARGHDVAAVSLRGHGNSDGRGPWAMRTHGIAGYVEDVARAASTMGGTPVVVGHSLGGFVVRRYLAEGGPAVAGILLAPVPTTGVLPLLLRLARAEPAAVARVFATLGCRPVVSDPARAARLLFSGRMPGREASRLHAMMGDESFRAFLELLRPRPDPSRVRVPVAVFAAGGDGILTQGEMEATARSLGTVPRTYLGMGHDMMLEPGWERLADDVSAWAATAAPAAAVAA